MVVVYVVTSGCYSDYGIEAAFSTLEKAEEHIGTRESDVRIELYVLDEPGAAPPVRRPWHVQMYLDGSRDGQFSSPYSDDIHPWQSREAIGKILTWKGSKRTVLRVDCWAENEQQAVKIANDIRTAYNAGALPLVHAQYDPARYPTYWGESPAAFKGAG